MPHPPPSVVPSTRSLCDVSGTFYRAVDPRYADDALSGSRAAGRFSPPGVPTLYLSSSPEGVAAAMIAHANERPHDLQMLALDVEATDIADLRDRAAMEALGVDLDAAAAPWQSDVRAGRPARPWRVRERLETMGARGLIDPSRQRPGLWHLTLFAWNVAGAARVR